MLKFRSFFAPLSGNLLVLVTSLTIWTFVYQMIGPYESLYLFALGGSGVILSLISTIQTFVSTALRVIGGYLADIRNPRILVGVVSIALAFVYLFYIFAIDWRWLVVGATLLSGHALYEPALVAIRANSIPPASRGRGFALYNTLPQIPAILAPTLGGLIISNPEAPYGIDLTGGRLLYGFVLVGMFSAGVIRFFFLRIRSRPDQEQTERSFSFQAFTNVFQTFRASRDAIQRLVFLNGVFMFCFHFDARFRGLYAVNIHSLTTVEWGIITSIAQIISLIATFGIGWLIDNYGRKRVFIPSILLLGTAVLIFIFSTSFVTILLAMILTATGLKSRMMALQVLVADTIPRPIRGRLFSLIDVSSSFGSMLSMVLAGILYDQVPVYPFYFAVAAYFIAAIIAQLYLQEASVRQD
jgi:MFS family permease